MISIDCNLANPLDFATKFQILYPQAVLAGSVGRLLQDVSGALSSRHDFDFVLSERDSLTFNFTSWVESEKKLLPIPGNYRHFSREFEVASKHLNCCLFILPDVNYECKKGIRVQKLSDLLDWKLRFDAFSILFKRARQGDLSVMNEPNLDKIKSSGGETPLHCLSRSGVLCGKHVLARYPWVKNKLLKQASDSNFFGDQSYLDLTISLDLVDYILSVPNSIKFITELT